MAWNNLRLIVGELQMADVRQQVGVALLTDFEGYTTMKPIPHHEAPLGVMLDQLTAWSTALRSVRQAAVAAAA